MKVHVVWFLALVFATGAPLAAQLPVTSSLEATTENLQKALEREDFAWKKSLKKYLATHSNVKLINQIEIMRRKTVGYEANSIDVSPSKGVFVYETDAGEIEVTFELSANPILITSISLEEESRMDLAPLTWDILESELLAAARDGFHGAVLVTKNGKIVIHEGYGLANREKEIPNRRDTIFAIGSAPIDFTHAAILVLKDRNSLRLDDKISRFLDEVPTDKAAMTVRHLMTGQSGLPDFHDLPTDKDPDHHWIDRDEAIRRIMQQKLLFAPGEDRRHSHSAWGLLAAIVEITSGQSYHDFCREHLYLRAGMTDTGFFGTDIPEDRTAVGYGERRTSEPNSPPHWGKTSWLVMGSGGQVSTLMDLYRWELAIREAGILSHDSKKLFLGKGNRVSADGDMYGFEFLHSHNPECMFMLISNSVSSREERKKLNQLGNRLYKLVRTEFGETDHESQTTSESQRASSF